MTNEIICPQCPAVYSTAGITATYGNEITTLAELNGGDGDAPHPDDGARRGGLFSRIAARPEPVAPPLDERPRPDLDQIRRLRAWTFTCPEGHEVDGNRGASLPIAVVGESGSSKSHFLPGLVWELDSKRALGALGISLREAIYTKIDLIQSMSLIYESHKVVGHTPPGALLGPYGYRLSIRHSDHQDDRYSLLLFDVAGEDLGSIVNIAKNAKFILMCRGIVILIDPVGILSTQFDLVAPTEQSLRSHLNTVRKGINRLADTLEEIYHVSSHRLDIPIVVAIAKADCIQWQFDWPTQTAAVLDAFQKGQGMAEILEGASRSVKEVLASSRAELLVEEISDRFDDRVTRYVAVSATSEMPYKPDAEGEAIWGEPDPNGAALTLLHILDMIGALKKLQAPRSERR
jgi:hypothetical protein